MSKTVWIGFSVQTFFLFLSGTSLFLIFRSSRLHGEGGIYLDKNIVQTFTEVIMGKKFKKMLIILGGVLAFGAGIAGTDILFPHEAKAGHGWCKKSGCSCSKYTRAYSMTCKCGHHFSAHD